MLSLFKGVWDIVYPRVGDTRRLSLRYALLLILIPIGGAVGWFYLEECTTIAIHDSGVIAASFGVLGGLLFAHAIFVFQLRVSYDAANVEPDSSSTQQDLRVRPLIDEMFNGVLYASFVALVLTLVSSFLAATAESHSTVPALVAAVVVGLTLHLAGAVIHVISATTTAFGVLKQQPRD